MNDLVKKKTNKSIIGIKLNFKHKKTSVSWIFYLFFNYGSLDFLTP